MVVNMLLPTAGSLESGKVSMRLSVLSFNLGKILVCIRPAD